MRRQIGGVSADLRDVDRSAALGLFYHDSSVNTTKSVKIEQLYFYDVVNFVCVNIGLKHFQMTSIWGLFTSESPTVTPA